MVGFAERENKNLESFVVSDTFIEEDKRSTVGCLEIVCEHHGTSQKNVSHFFWNIDVFLLPPLCK